MTKPGKVNQMGPMDKFVPGGLSLDGFRQHMYNRFIFDLPPHNYKGPVYLMTPPRTTVSPYVDKCKGNAFVSVGSVNDAYEWMMEAIDNKTACWLKG
ncbi:hypothetical protein JVU11DRAFT_10189 [Chiua virens]|nr:hypothetical protein JVU11DRAFT_10189 [Chiua virens]